MQLFENSIQQQQQPQSIQKITSALPDQLNQVYYKQVKDKKEIQPFDPLNPVGPYMKITVIKSNVDAANMEEYFVTYDGVHRTEKNTDTEDVIIGRQQATSDNTRPNDIVLPASDRAISRIHCKILYKDGFKVKRQIPDNILAFLMTGHKRLGQKSCFKRFPPHLYRLIYDFSKNPRKFYIVDIGSVFGTYIRIKPSTTYSIEKGQAYLIGADIIFQIIDMCKEIKSDVIQKKLMNKQFEKELYQQLAYEKKNKVELHGLTEAQKEAIDSICNLQIDEKQFSEQINETFINGQSLGVPFLKVEFQNSAHQTSQHHLFLSNQEEAEFKLGRAQDCNVVINHNTISRKQCRLKYSQGEWQIFDGDTNKESANGTWFSLTDFRLKKGRQESEPREIENDCEIKISDSILKVEIFNNS